MTDLNADLASLAAQALDAVAKHLKQSGHADQASALVRQAAEIELMSAGLQDCWGGPFNGQAGRLAIVEEVLKAIEPAAVVETGTYRGISTLWFAQHFAGPVWSCEAEELYLLQARHRLRDFANVELQLADSRAFLERVVPGLERDAPVFFYLDAHWKKDLPLREELKIIFAALPKAVVMIDDFRIPDDPGYAWDDYGPGARVDATALAGAVPPDTAVHVPVLPSADETGAKRGCCVVTGVMGDAIDRCRLLKRRSLADLEPSAEALGSHEREVDVAGDPADSDGHLAAELRKEIAAINLDRAQRLQDIQNLHREIDTVSREAKVLTDDRVILLRDVHTLTGLVETSRAEAEMLRAERSIHLKDNETLTAEIHRLYSRVADIEQAGRRG